MCARLPAKSTPSTGGGPFPDEQNIEQNHSEFSLALLIDCSCQLAFAFVNENNPERSSQKPKVRQKHPLDFPKPERASFNCERIGSIAQVMQKSIRTENLHQTFIGSNSPLPAGMFL